MCRTLPADCLAETAVLPAAGGRRKATSVLLAAGRGWQQVWGTHGAGSIQHWLLLLRGPVVELGGRDEDNMRGQRWTDDLSLVVWVGMS